MGLRGLNGPLVDRFSGPSPIEMRRICSRRGDQKLGWSRARGCLASIGGEEAARRGEKKAKGQFAPGEGARKDGSIVLQEWPSSECLRFLSLDCL